MDNKYKELSASFSQVEGAVQSTKKELTKKGYDTTGIGYQYVADRFNDVLGTDGWGFDFVQLKETQGTYKSGQPFFEVTVKVSIWVGDFQNQRHCVGGHISPTYSDALKGAITNGFKKTAAFWGVGREAYAGQLDDDTSYGEEVGGYGSAPAKQFTQVAKAHASAALNAPKCEHGAMELKVTKKAGPNLGREFWSCTQPMGKKCANGFKWADEVESKEPIIDQDGDTIIPAGEFGEPIDTSLPF